MAGLAPKPVPPQHTVLPPSRQVEDCGRRSTGPGLLNAWLGTLDAADWLAALDRLPSAPYLPRSSDLIYEMRVLDWIAKVPSHSYF